MGFLASTETAITGGFTSVATTFGSGLLGTFRPAFIIGFTIWITLIAYEVAFGKTEDGFTYLFTKIGKVFLIGVLALYGWPEIAELLEGIKGGFVNSNTISTILEAKLINPMGDLWVELWRWFAQALAPLGFPDIVDILNIIVIFVVVILGFTLMSAAVGAFGVIALGMYLVANSIFILLLAIGPFFLLCLAFPFLQRFFETFIGSVMTSIFAMAFTVLMVFFVANLFNLNNISAIVPAVTATTTLGTFGSVGKSMAALFASKCGTAVLIIYLYYKVFDLAAALGGGLNMGNNMIGGVRNIMRDAQRGGGGAGKGSSSTTNQIAQGTTGSSGGSTGAVQRASRANSTFTGMAASAVSPAISAVSSTAMAGASNVARIASYGAGRAAGAVGRFAYNRNSQVSNRMSNAG